MIRIPRTPDSYVRELGVRVRFGWVADGAWGSYDADLHVITLRPGLGPLQLLCTLMHELGHAAYRHHGRSAKQEREANAWAAVRLISKKDFIDAYLERQDALGIAHRLGVLPDVVEHYITALSKAERDSLAELLKARLAA